MGNPTGVEGNQTICTKHSLTVQTVQLLGVGKHQVAYPIDVMEGVSPSGEAWFEAFTCFYHLKVRLITCMVNISSCRAEASSSHIREFQSLS